jgi:hypothetical protein
MSKVSDLLGLAPYLRSVLEQKAEQEARLCLMCHYHGKRVVSTLVSRDSSGFEWFECVDHGPTDNVARLVRVSSEPISEWISRILFYG